MLKRKTYKPIKTQYLNLNDLSEEELVKRLYIMVAGIIITIAVLLVSFIFFAPKIGGLFGFVSKHYNEKEVTPNIAPVAPVFVNIPESVNEEKVTINGISEPGTTVKLFVNGPEAQTAITDSEGKFTFVDIQLIKGKNILFAKALNSQNKESENSATVEIGFDNTKPEITIDSPKNKTTVRNLDSRVLVTGKVNEKAVVRINDRLAILKPDLSFELLLGVNEGNVEIKVEATDMAGNKADQTINITYVKSS
jgi:hypothetical protein